MRYLENLEARKQNMSANTGKLQAKDIFTGANSMRLECICITEFLADNRNLQDLKEVLVIRLSFFPFLFEFHLRTFPRFFRGRVML